MKILIADDHPLVRDALARSVQQLAPQAELLQAADRQQAELLLQQHAPVALALVDLRMPGMQAIEGVRRLVGHPGLRVAVVSGEDDPAIMRAAYAAGAVAFLPKSESPEVLQQALAAVLQGGSWMPAAVLAELRAGHVAPRGDLASLTPRQADVLRCLQRGLPNKLIARELGLTEGTVKIHIAAILRALGVRNRTEAVVVAQRMPPRE